MTKQLFRVNFVNPKNSQEEELVEITKSFQVSDKAISEHIPVHILDLPASYAQKKNIGVYGRDQITEWGNSLFVTPGLLNRSSKSPSPFEKLMRKAGYRKKIFPDEVLSEGGLYVFGKELILISDRLKQNKEALEKVVKDSGLNLPIYFLPSTTSHSDRHIDSDYQIIDSLKLIYGCHNLFNKGVDGTKKALSQLEIIAKRHNYDLRLYEFDDTALLDDEDYDLDINKLIDKLFHNTTIKVNGINCINNGIILTSSIHPEEKDYLKQKGLETLIIPLGDVNPGAGLRCVYGEFNL